MDFRVSCTAWSSFSGLEAELAVRCARSSISPCVTSARPAARFAFELRVKLIVRQHRLERPLPQGDTKTGLRNQGFQFMRCGSMTASFTRAARRIQRRLFLRAL